MKLALLLLAAWMQAVEGPEQPIPYSHKQHIALGLKCAECHAMPDLGELMTFPATSKCMGCHTTVKKDSVAIKKLASYAEANEPVPWVRVYQIPDSIFFNHKAHLSAGATCAKCHGEVKDRDRIAKEFDLSMAACMKCHSQNKASLACNYCHERP